jgi:hypothetical protein
LVTLQVVSRSPAKQQYAQQQLPMLNKACDLQCATWVKTKEFTKATTTQKNSQKKPQSKACMSCEVIAAPTSIDVVKL